MALWRLRTTVDDRPGFLAVLTASLALRSVNILSVQVHSTEAGAVDDFLVEAPNDLTEEELLAAVAKGRGRDAWVRQTESPDVVDPTTEMLGAVLRIVRDPDEIADTLASVILASMVRSVPSETSTHPGFSPTRMQLIHPRGGLLLVERLAPAFTEAEFDRATALVQVAAEAMASRLSTPSGAA